MTLDELISIVDAIDAAHDDMVVELRIEPGGRIVVRGFTSEGKQLGLSLMSVELNNVDVETIKEYCIRKFERLRDAG